MALKLRRTSASRVRLLSTFIAVFALLAQPMYGFVASQVANAAVEQNTVCAADAKATCDYSTVSEAIGSVAPGSTINVKAGTYSEDLVKIDKKVTLKGESRNNTFFNGQLHIVAPGVNVSNFGIKTTDGKNGYSISVNAPNATISKNTFLSNTASGSAKSIYIENNSHNTTIVSNTLNGITSATGGAYGILAKSVSGLVVSDNDIKNLAGSWATAIGLEGDTPGAVVSGNEIKNLTSRNYQASAVKFENNPSAGTISVFEGNTYGNMRLSTDLSVVSVDHALAETPVKNSKGQAVYQEKLSHDNVYRYYGLNVFSKVQDGLSAVAENGTVKVADGTYIGSVEFKKNGVTLTGQSHKGVKLYPKSNSEGGVYATGLNNLTVSELSIYADTQVVPVAPTSMIKLVNGHTARIKHVDVFAGGAKTTGVDINSFSNATLDNVAVNNAGKDGVSVTAKTNSVVTHKSDDVTLKNVDIRNAAWSGIAFYTTSKSEQTDISGVQFGSGSSIGGNGERGIYFEGLSGNVIKGLDGKPLDINNIELTGNLGQHIVNEQEKDVVARHALFNGKTGDAMNPAERTAQDAMIFDKRDDSARGLVDYYSSDNTQPRATLEAQPGFLGGKITIKGSVSDNYDLSHYNLSIYPGDVDLKSGKSLSGLRVNKDAGWDAYDSMVPVRGEGPIDVARELDTTKLKDGDYQIRLGVADKADNKEVFGESVAVIRITIDNHPPVVSINPLAPSNASVPVEFTGRVDGTQVALSLWNGAAKLGDVTDIDSKNGAWRFVLQNGLDEGVHTITVIATDAALLQSASQITFKVGPFQSSNKTPLREVGGTGIGYGRPTYTLPTGFAVSPIATQSTDASSDEDVLGASDTKTASPEKTVAVIEPSAQGWKLFGFAWFWWVLLGAAIAAGWWMIAAARRRRDDAAY